MGTSWSTAAPWLSSACSPQGEKWSMLSEPRSSTTGTLVNRTQLLKRLDEAWTALNASYADLPRAELVEPGVIGAWSIKDIIMHVATWEAESLAHLPTVLAGGRPPRYSALYGGINAFNALATERNRNVSVAAAFKHRDETHRRLVDFVRTIPEAQITTETTVRRRLRLDTWSHYRTHTEAIWKWRRKHEERS